MLTIHGGRTRRLWTQLLKAVAASRRQKHRCVLLVPEQYTLQAERDLIAGLSLNGFFDLDVYSPSRFVQRIFMQYGSGGQVRIDANGKNIAMARALNQCKKQLRYYARSIQRRGFIDQSGEWVADMKRAGVTAAQLRAYADEQNQGAYRDKFSDLSEICAAYDQVLENKFVDGEDVLAYAIETIPRAGIVHDADVFVYGFDIITDDFARLLCAVAADCRDAHVYLVMEREEARDGDCFKPVRDSAERLRTYLRKQNLRREWLWDATGEIDAPEDLRYLERNLLLSAPIPYAQEPAHISLFEAATPYAEAHYIAQKISMLLEKGIAADSIMVLCGNFAQYASALKSVFSSYEIPHYVIEKAPLQYHGLVRMVLAALRAATGGYRREDMLLLIKSGFTPLEEEECWQLENYVLRYGIVGAKWHHPFTRGDEEEREVPERARQKLSGLLLTLQQELREASNGAESLSAPLHFIMGCGAYERLLAEEERLAAAGMDMEVLRSRQVWTRVLALFEQLHEITGDMRVPGRKIATLLEAGLIDNEIAGIPPRSGSIAIGEVGNLIPVEPYALFVCGLDSSMNTASTEGLLSEEEKDAVSADLDAYLGMHAVEHDLMGDLDLWKVFSSPRGELHLSRAQALPDGTALRPAQIVSSVRKLFPQMVALGGVTEEQMMLHPLAPQAALEEMGTRLRAGTLAGQWLAAWNYLYDCGEHRELMRGMLKEAQDDGLQEALSPVMAKMLFTDRLISVSRLESFAACPYQHFVQYGLRPKERKEWGVDASDRGVFFHAAMEGFTRTLPQNPMWPKISRQECDQMMDAALQPLTENWQNDALGDSARARAESKRYINICKRVAWAFTKGAKQSAFRPSEIEVAFGYPGGPPPLTLDLPDGTRVSVRGRIDRIDRFDNGEQIYLRVVDYKSGVKALDAARIYMGIQLQLLLYLEAALKYDGQALPAGAFYQWMGDPLVDQQKKGLIESELAKRLCLKGVMLSDVQVVEWMDNGKPPISVEDVFKKDGTPKKGKLVCTLEELNELIDLAHHTAVQLTQEIRRGDIRVSPVVDKSNIAHCKNCSFAGVCRRDSQAHPQERALPDVTMADLLKKYNMNS